MVRDQIERRGVTDRRVLEAMQTVPRHLFVPPEYRARAYDDCPITIGGGQTISQPYMVAMMTQLLDLRPTDRVLEVGTGSGYQTAVLACLASMVVSIERHPDLGKRAQATLERLGIHNAKVFVGDGTLGCREYAPYNAILVTAGGPRVPPSLRKQLAERGRLVCPVGTRKVQRIVRFRRIGTDLVEEEGIGCVFVPLIGREGWHEPPEPSAS